jgi:hypothetical protein
MRLVDIDSLSILDNIPKEVGEKHLIKVNGSSINNYRN